MNEKFKVKEADGELNSCREIEGTLKIVGGYWSLEE
jgi:hypothetical protein